MVTARTAPPAPGNPIGIRLIGRYRVGSCRPKSGIADGAPSGPGA